jgi:hypothetical protein
MRNLLALLGAAVVTFAFVGWLLDWYSIKRDPSGKGAGPLRIDINTPRISNDLAKGREKVQKFLNAPDQGSAEPPPAPKQEEKPQAPPAPTPPRETPRIPLLPPSVYQVLPDGTIVIRPPSPPAPRPGASAPWYDD